MTSLTLNNVVDLQSTTTAESTINSNNAAIVTAVQGSVAKTGDQMTGSLDLNSNRIINLPAPIGVSEPLRLADANTLNGGGTINALPAGGTTGQVLAKTSNTSFAVAWDSVSSLAGGQALSSANDTNVTLVLSGTPTTCLLEPATVTAGWTGTLSVARGGTGDSGTAWSTWTPTVTAGTGTITTLGTVTARFKTIGKTVFFYVSVPITTNGTGASFVQITLPVAAANTVNQSGIGRENGVTGKNLGAKIVKNTANLQVTFYDGTYPGANGAEIDINGIYESI